MFDLTVNVSLIFIFIEGILSFFSPCILPILPLYFSYLGGNAKSVKEDGTIEYHRGKVFVYTISFILGISCAFFLLGLSFFAFGKFFEQYKDILIRIGGLLIVLLGLMQMGLFQINFFQREWRLPLKITGKKMNVIVAFIMGFTFSFAWTPCVGPALSSVLIMAGSASTALLGMLYIMIYAIGFVLPFLIIALFTTSVLNLMKKHQASLQVFIRIGGVVLVIIGFMMFAGVFHPVDNNSSTPPVATEEKQDAIDFTLKDLDGKEIKLSDYKGKVVYLNFWATWCPPCKEEIPALIETYHEYGSNQEEVVVLSVVMPGGQEQDEVGIRKFVKDNNIDYPVLIDEGFAFSSYGVSSLPTTFMIDKSFKIKGYIQGGLTKEHMNSIIEQTMTAE